MVTQTRSWMLPTGRSDNAAFRLNTQRWKFLDAATCEWRTQWLLHNSEHQRRSLAKRRLALDAGDINDSGCFWDPKGVDKMALSSWAENHHRLFIEYDSDEVVPCRMMHAAASWTRPSQPC